MTTVIRVENLSKKYRIQHQQRERYTSLRDVIAHRAKSLFRAQTPAPNHQSPSHEDFWALKDVSFEIKQGEVVGIIGRNGAGKSTLLKILSRITEPTTGRVAIKGRIASLLEVGTGFHPELNGRENIYLNGAILGMTKAEINKKLDEIVAFAGIEKFLDTPVKRYSSGMYVRLAFAVAAHLEPEILVIDEVLAVGDAEFQKRCLSKMETVARDGKTVLFVSHNMKAVEQLCSNALLLEQGSVIEYSPNVRGVIKDYLFTDDEIGTREWINNGNQFDNPWFKPLHLFISDEQGIKCPMPTTNDLDVWIKIAAEVKELDPALTVGYAIYSEDGHLLYWSYQTDQAPSQWPQLHRGLCVLKSRIPKRLFNEGTYRIELIGGLHFRQWLFEPSINAPFIYLTIQGGLSDSPLWMITRPGILAPVMEWFVDNEIH